MTQLTVLTTLLSPLRQTRRTSALRAGLLALALATGSLSALAALDVGDKAPPFSIDASLAGKVFKFSLTDKLKSGPVVLYFFPAAFSNDCTIEAHQFAEATEQYNQLGATVIGVSSDDIDTLKRFSTTECRNKFAVASDVDQAVMKSYDAVLFYKTDYANRTSYVIAPNGTIVYQFTSLNPTRHVANTLGALKTWIAKKP